MRLRMYKVDVRVSDSTYYYYVEASRASVACQRAEKMAVKEHLRRGFHHNPAPFTLSLEKVADEGAVR